MITVIVPVFNEQNTLPFVLREVCHLFPNAQIIIIDNNSTDNSKLIINNFATEYTNIEHFFCSKKGKSNAIRSIYDKIKNNIVVLQDADLEYRVNEIPKLVDEHIKTKADMTVGVRKNKLIRSEIANLAIKLILLLRFGVLIKDVLTGARIVNKALLTQCKSEEFGLETELTKLALKQKLKIVQGKCHYTPRIEGKKIKAIHMIELVKAALC